MSGLVFVLSGSVFWVSGLVFGVSGFVFWVLYTCRVSVCYVECFLPLDVPWFLPCLWGFCMFSGYCILVGCCLAILQPYMASPTSPQAMYPSRHHIQLYSAVSK